MQGERTVRGKIQEYGTITQISVVPSVILLEVLVHLSLKEHIAGLEEICKKVMRMINAMRIYLQNYNILS